MAEAKPKVFVAKPRELDAGSDTLAPKKRLIRAKSEAKVGSHILQDWTIELATHDEVHALGKEGVEIENAAE